ncbi:flagellin [Cupriavidus sp. CP313]
MVQTSAKTLAPCRSRAAGPATAVVLLGAGMACASAAQASEQPLPDALDAAALPTQATTPAHESMQDKALAAVTRGSMAGWKPVSEERLDKERGGFETGGLQVSFGIERAVYVNGALVVATSITIPDVARITTDQATKLAATLGPAILANTQAGSNGTSSSASSTGASASASGTPGAAGASGLPATVVATPTGQVVTNGLLAVIQNGPGNAAAVGNMAGTPMTVIQNTLNDQSIRSLMTIDASVNTLQAFRSQVANATLNNALLQAASMR